MPDAITSTLNYPGIKDIYYEMLEERLNGLTRLGYSGSSSVPGHHNERATHRTPTQRPAGQAAPG